MSNKDSERPAGPSQPVRVSTMPPPKGLDIRNDWEYLLEGFASWEARRNPYDPHFMDGTEGETPEQTFQRVLREGHQNTMMLMTGHACPVVYGTMNTRREPALLEVYAELALRMPGLHSPIDSLRLSSNGNEWILRSPLEIGSLPPFAKFWRSGRTLFEEVRLQAKKTADNHVILPHHEQVPYIIDWMCLEAQRLDPLLRAIFAEQP